MAFNLISQLLLRENNVMADTREAAMSRLKAEGLSCTRCDLYQNGTPVVWGEGNLDAGVVIIGQGPGEQEAKQERPFVGPAGELLNEALGAAQINRDKLWITNAIKHWATNTNPRGRLVNRSPKVGELQACRIWWENEVAIIKPKVILCLGAPAAQAVIDKKFKITQGRGQWFKGANGEDLIATFHPSYLIRLRAADPKAFEGAWQLVLNDLQAVVERAGEHGVSLA
jgi:uracil-DNA glycosylase family protein